MKNLLYMIFFLTASTLSCQKENISFSTGTADVFYVSNAGSSMRVLVEGNTASKLYVLVIHGGPGASSYIYNTAYISNNLEDKCAMVYWDQRNSGGSQGNANGSSLNLARIVGDLKKVILVLKYRYGEDIKIYLLGHSFGGMISAAFLTTPGYQEMVAGYINVDASHDYPVNDSLTRLALMKTGFYEISKGKRITKWGRIIKYCTSHSANFTLEESQKLESYASEAENLIDSVKYVDIASRILRSAVDDKTPVSSILVNLVYSEDSEFNKELLTTRYSGQLGMITIPVLVLWGKYDFVCPLSLGMDFYSRISSADKRLVVSPVSGHNIIYQDEKLFCDEVGSFILAK